LGREALFVEATGGPRFCLLTHSANRPRGCVLYVHPFAEEMNKSRRTAAQAAAAFAAQGFEVVQPDLYGCGDSFGDFGDATWSAWIDDIERAVTRFCARCEGPSVVWGLRAGALLASQWLAATGRSDLPLLLWQPVTSGRQHLTQFLRLKAAGEMLADAQAGSAMADARAALAAGRAVEVAGYELNADLAAGLGAAQLQLPEAYRAPVALIEVGEEDAGPSPAVAALTQKWCNASARAMACAVGGPRFWQTPEIETAPRLIERSCAWLQTLDS
jgi:exosortase A-associated hydrolase 2